jgi:DNA mismatch repair protein MutS
MSGGETLTPMMKQYQGMKKSLPAGVLLFFRLGDFYELFFEDAKAAAGVLGLTLTKRNSVPMCGVPYHAAENYIAKLVQAGHRVAIGEQSGEVKPGKLVERRISQVVSAGTIDDFRLLENDRPNYLAAVAKNGRLFGLAYADMTTGEFRAAEFTDEQALLDELARIEPAETLVPDDGAGLPEVPHSQPGDGYTFLPEHARELLAEHFGVHSLDGFGCGGMTAAIGAAGAILHYLATRCTAMSITCACCSPTSRSRTCSSTPPRRRTWNWSSRAPEKNTPSWPRSIARALRWAPVCYGIGCCIHCAIARPSSRARM